MKKAISARFAALRHVAPLILLTVTTACATVPPPPASNLNEPVAATATSTVAPAGTSTRAATARPTATAAAARTVLPPTPQAVSTTASKATSAPSSAAAATPKPATSSASTTLANAIVVKPASDRLGAIKTVQTTMNLVLKGTGANNTPIDGTMDMTVFDDAAGKKRDIEIKGNLIGQLLASQLRGFNPRSLGIFTINNESYVRLDTLLTICAKPRGGIPGLDGIATSLSVEGFLGMMGGQISFAGKLVGEEMIGDLAVKHYTLDLAAMKAQAQQRGIKNWPELSRGEVWIARDGDYIVRMAIDGKGKLANVAGNSFDGNFNVVLDTSNINKPLNIALPPSCSRAIEI